MIESASGMAARSAWSTSAVRSAPSLPSNLSPVSGTLSSLMFSTTPRTLIPTLRQKLISLRTSMSATSCGVVTMMAPSIPACFKSCAMLMCSSEVPGGASTIRKSSSPQSTSFTNCLMRAFFRGPRQTTASSLFGSMKPIDITPRLSCTYTGDHPAPLWCTSSPSRPSILGIDGPHMSTSSNPTSLSLPARASDSCAATVLLPTPPFPDNTSTLCLTPANRCATASSSGSGPFGAVEHVA
mmetsp:Transcript_15787/g.51751  ORF Transcript_15787/g.51751 Transcript_15787/m.51751 type:complete len:240 (-) Transcript_15787:95-814(-)